jgi:glycosyltransferase involved in cell wall biosynthesis
MNHLVWIDPINRDAHFVKLMSEVLVKYLDDFQLFTTNRSAINLNPNINFNNFFQDLPPINTGKISLANKIQLLTKYNSGFQAVLNNIQPNTIVLYSSGMSLPELELIGIQKVQNKASKVVMLVHNLQDNQSKFKWLSQWRNRKLLEAFDGWIFLSDYMKKQALSRLNIPQGKTYVMPHPHFRPMLKDIQPSQNLFLELQKFAQNRLVMAYISRADKSHGIDIFYQVLHLLQTQGIPICGVVIGRLGKDWNLQKNNVLIKHYGLGPEQLYVHLGTYTYPELMSVLRITDFVLAPYKQISQSGAIALALGEEVPVIASSVGANSEMVQDGINGFLFDLYNLDKLIQDIVMTYNNSQTMRKRFPVTSVFNQHLNPYPLVENMLNWLENKIM